ncbi:TRAP transporter substrate-binding protein [Psychrosphaera sp. B3R10]|uniref:TRAP transporter substrate-binding protein n=1 Tax=unclassified Psychrosphaera TaxID=2641570 RepID=UPI001C0A49C2|nr:MULTISPECIES: TRAP transporter substrate-binding protein [unclassified Psychrosphaera]MBU2883554.1 TRAP transporter substrate-binding protein [Psychrosphaera sp. I2R16]MBU2989733.1 TRAP transporter substrate-binding protein [Psychrosphaera sp. B3R10]
MITKIRLLFGAALLALVGCTPTDQTSTSIRLAHGLDIQHPVHKALVFMDEELQRLSSGQMNLVIYPSGQLGSEREIIELIQIGTMGMTKVSASSLEAFVPQMKVFSLPYLFTDQTHYWQTLNSDIGQSLLDAGTDYRVKGLGYFDAGSRSFYTTDKLVEKPSDLNGLKIRVMNSQSAVDMVNTIGGAATPVSWGELYTALQQGIVEGAENNPPSFFFSKHYEVSKYYLLDEHTSIPDVIIIGTHMWNKLSEQQQAWLTIAMQRATDYQRQLWHESTLMSLNKVKEAGVKVMQADKVLFQKSVEPIYQALANQPIMTLINDIRALGDRHED